jgi:2,4-dienoyl-CoA reductase-like NADH-dependent reductase (Old Yellow Enzyme family)
MKIFEQASIGNCILNNRIIRSATYEGACSENGVPTEEYYKLYSKLSKGNPGLIITGFMYIDASGKAMQSRQAGLDSADKIIYYKKLTDEVHQNGSKIFAQLALTGRQTTLNRVPEVVGASAKKSMYFKTRPRVLSEEEIYSLVNKFALSAQYAKEAGFDGVQIHAAHGYLVHQFLLSSINNRKDIFGVNPESKTGSKFLELIIKKIRETCGDAYPIIIKISGSDDYIKKFSKRQFIHFIKFLNEIKVDAIEISYGTMDYALNIFRGDIPVDLILKINPVYGKHGKIYNLIFKLLFPFIRLKFKSFKPMYNLNYALIAKKYTNIPIIVVGGFRNTDDINYAINKEIEFVSMCRPFICEPDIVEKFSVNNQYHSKCRNCNYCAIMCDSGHVTKCYKV